MESDLAVTKNNRHPDLLITKIKLFYCLKFTLNIPKKKKKLNLHLYVTPRQFDIKHYNEKIILPLQYFLKGSN